MALKLKPVVSISNPNPDDILAAKSDEEIIKLIEDIDSTDISYMQWKKVDVDIGDQIKKKMKCVTVTESKEAFKHNISESLGKFRSHTARVSEQYRAVKQLKARLSDNESLIQIDISENYSCQTMDEVQSAYWKKTQMTRHPAVAYYKQDGERPSICLCRYLIGLFNSWDSRGYTIDPVSNIFR